MTWGFTAMGMVVCMTAPEATERLVAHICELEAFGHRGSATAHEHRAADYLIGELGAIGLRPMKEPFAGARSHASRLLMHIIVAVAGAALAWKAPAAAVIFGVTALISLVAEQSTRILLLSRPVVRYRSWNLRATITPVRPARRRIVLCAH